MEWEQDIEAIKELSHNHWESYSGMKGSNQALRRANSCLYNAIKWGRKRIENDSMVDHQKVGYVCRDRVFKVLSNLGQWGFRDTEPQCATCYFIEKWLQLDAVSIERW